MSWKPWIALVWDHWVQADLWLHLIKRKTRGNKSSINNIFFSCPYTHYKWKQGKILKKLKKLGLILFHHKKDHSNPFLLLISCIYICSIFLFCKCCKPRKVTNKSNDATATEHLGFLYLEGCSYRRRVRSCSVPRVICSQRSYTASVFWNLHLLGSIFLRLE